MERFLVRIVFCLFADDTGIFDPRDIFYQFIEERTSADGADLGPWLSQLFQVLNTPVENRSEVLDEDLDRFPYVNGALFDGQLDIPSFTSEMRASLLDACRFNWSSISPAIFGALFQSVMDPEQRRAQGAHYTTEKNILKVIGPLFLDDLSAQLDRLRQRRDSRRLAGLRDFRKQLSEMRLFDPACGCGNFLIIAYRELRLLEIEAIREIRAATEATGQMSLSADIASDVNVDQCFGIEIGEFPARIAETALWMMDHIMNNLLSLELGQAFARIPLEVSPRIVCGDALETDWDGVLPPEDCSYVLGNPPFVGSKYQTEEQRQQVQRVASRGTLDYVAAWFVKAAEYVRTSRARIGFVSTNSITQGEQVTQLWPVLLDEHGLEISFAHRTFAWGSDARGKAHVHVVIVGLDRKDQAPRQRRLFSYDDPGGDPDVTIHTAISPYLTSADGLSDTHLTVRSQSKPTNGLPPLVIGSKPIDGGHYIFTDEERDDFLAAEPVARQFIRPYVGAREYIQGTHRWILALHNAEPETLKAMPLTRKRMAAVKEARQASTTKDTRELADTPTLYHVNVIPDAPFLVIPQSTSQRREYVPIGWLEPPTIPSNLVSVLENATDIDPAGVCGTVPDNGDWTRRTAETIDGAHRIWSVAAKDRWNRVVLSLNIMCTPTAERVVYFHGRGDDAYSAEIWAPSVVRWRTGDQTGASSAVVTLRDSTGIEDDDYAPLWVLADDDADDLLSRLAGLSERGATGSDHRLLAELSDSHDPDGAKATLRTTGYRTTMADCE